MIQYVIRHALAGDRHSWAGEDLVRPLSDSVWAQAAAMADRLASAGVTALYSSPYTRCVQTLEPLAARLGLTVRADDRLTEGAPFEGALELLATAGDGAVLCSHGDVVPELIQALARRGMLIEGRPDWRKGTIWVLERDGAGVTRGAVEPPPHA
jgi:8-oxo-dGTP diphosphatase